MPQGDKPRDTFAAKCAAVVSGRRGRRRRRSEQQPAAGGAAGRLAAAERSVAEAFSLRTPVAHTGCGHSSVPRASQPFEHERSGQTPHCPVITNRLLPARWASSSENVTGSGRPTGPFWTASRRGAAAKQCSLKRTHQPTACLALHMIMAALACWGCGRRHAPAGGAVAAALSQQPQQRREVTADAAVVQLATAQREGQRSMNSKGATHACCTTQSQQRRKRARAPPPLPPPLPPPTPPHPTPHTPPTPRCSHPQHMRPGPSPLACRRLVGIMVQPGDKGATMRTSC